MKVQILVPFRSKKYKRVMKAGETVECSRDWATKIVSSNLGKVIESPMKKREKKILGKEVETASLEKVGDGS